MSRARVSQDVIEVLVSFSGPAAPYVPTANQSVLSAANVKVVTGLTETIVNGCDLTATGSPASVLVVWDIWFSQNLPAGAKTCRLQLRRTNAGGAVLATSSTYTAPSSNAGGLAQEWYSNYTDASPTDYHYVITIQEMTAGNTTTEVWSGSQLMRLNPTVKAIVSQDVIEALVAISAPKVRVSQDVIEVLMADSETQSPPPSAPGAVATTTSYGFVS
jgi:hypothetical protein